MDTIEALYILKHSPDKIAEKMKSFIYGFNGRREVNYFDLFLFYSLYSYNPAYNFFDKQMPIQNNYLGNFFIDKTNEAPEIFANFNIDFYQTIFISKEAIIYGVSSSYFSMDKEMNIYLVKKKITTKDRVAENIGKLFSSQSTAYLYNFFKVDINAI